MSNLENGKFCLECSKALVGKQSKFCGEPHRQKYGRKNRERVNERTKRINEGQTDNSLVDLQNTKRDLARAEGMIVSIESERDRVIVERDRVQVEKDKLADKLLESEGEKRELKVENRYLQEKLDEQKTSSTNPNNVIWIVSMLIVILIVTVIYVVVNMS